MLALRIFNTVQLFSHGLFHFRFSFFASLVYLGENIMTRQKYSKEIFS